ncbi:hypothetical protein VA596_41405 [Amycolatopsis sp., V23-08]|uniref:HNH endonuclease n=1 Tax=Amycolatopsis heterodermiae TaxID=3110235 RepID=A0ABU5RJZ3_9PSEU|nr:hypothetical protein [Amycolatopsis sp., V23-08]MEA5366044.1 hypothetical protein [Amycolatopsis sp., V23-08]
MTDQTARVATVLTDDATVQGQSRAVRWGLYLAQHGVPSNLPTDFGLGRHPGNHRIEQAAGLCLADVPRPRPAGPVELETRPDPCTRCNEIGHFATVRLTADPERGLRGAHEGLHEVCPCCAFPQGKAGLYDVMRGQARTSGYVGVELRQPNGRWV